MSTVERFIELHRRAAARFDASGSYADYRTAADAFAMLATVATTSADVAAIAAYVVTLLPRVPDGWKTTFFATVARCAGEDRAAGFLH